MDKLISISEAADVLGVSVTTLRRWEREDKLSSYRTHSGHRRYKLSEIITVFSARLYGSRSRKNQKLLDGVKKAVEEAVC